MNQNTEALVDTVLKLSETAITQLVEADHLVEILAKIADNQNLKFRQIPDHAGYYCDNFGRIWHLTNGKNFKEVSPILNVTTGYYGINYNKSFRMLHRLVCLAWHVKPVSEEKLSVDHIDGDKSNNNPSNLRWVSHYDNCQCNPATPPANPSQKVMHVPTGKVFRSVSYASTHGGGSRGAIRHQIKNPDSKIWKRV